MDIIFSDGYNNKKGCGYVITDKDGKLIEHQSYEPGTYTNNECEYFGVLKAITYKPEIIYTDSMLVVGQVTQGWKINAEHLRKHAEILKELSKEYNTKIYYVYREDNEAGKYIEEHIK